MTLHSRNVKGRQEFALKALKRSMRLLLVVAALWIGSLLVAVNGSFVLSERYLLVIALLGIPISIVICLSSNWQPAYGVPRRAKHLVGQCLIVWIAWALPSAYGVPYAASWIMGTEELQSYTVTGKRDGRRSRSLYFVDGKSAFVGQLGRPILSDYRNVTVGCVVEVSGVRIISGFYPRKILSFDCD